MIPPRVRTFLAVVVALFFCSAAVADNWTRFRGPNGTGVVTDPGVPVQWKKENYLWKQEVPGDGHSSPVVWENRLFLQTAIKNTGARRLLCLNADTGKQLWAKTISANNPVIRKHRMNSYASSTPAVDSERVYAVAWTGNANVMAAYTHEGKKLWTRELAAFKSQHGPGASPVVWRDMVFYFNDQDKDFAEEDAKYGKSTLFALDAKSGKILWKQERPPYRTCYSAPFLWERDDQPELVVISTLEFTGYDPKTGNVNWRWGWKHFAKRALRVTGSPAFLNGTIYGSSGDGGGDRYMVAVKVNDAPAANPKMTWSNKRDFPYVPTMLAYKGMLFFTNDHGLAGCFHAATGKQIWMKRISDTKFTSSPVIVNGKLYAANEDGDVFVLAADDNFKMLARNSLGQRIRASAAVANGRMYYRGQRHLFCIGRAK